MAVVDIPGSSEAYPATIEIILRATRLGLFTAAEAGQLIDRVRSHTTTSTLSIQDSGPTGTRWRTENLSASPDRTAR